MAIGLNKYLPNEQISDSIEYFFTLELERSEAKVERILPSISDAFILNYGSPLLGHREESFFEFPKCFIHKADEKPRNIQFNHQVCMMGVVFKTGMVSRFTNVPLATTPSRVFSEFLLDPVFIFGKEIKWLFEATKEISSLSDRIKILEQFLIKKHQAHQPGLHLLKKALRRMTASDGKASISKVSKATNLNDRYLRKLFARYVGISPKRLGEIMRIRKALTLMLHDKYSISEAAFCLEYHDLAHFSHSFKRIIGTSPKHYFSEKNEVNHLFLTPNMHQEGNGKKDPSSWLRELFL